MLLNYSAENNPVQASQDYVNDAINPTSAQAFHNAAWGAIISPLVAGQDLYSHFTKEPLGPIGEDLQTQADTFNDVASSATGIAGIAAQAGSLAGTFLNPLTVFPVAKAASWGMEGVSGLLNYSVGKGIIADTALNASIGKLAGEGIGGAAAGMVASAAPAVQNNFNELNKSINWGGVAKETLMGGAQGLGMGLAIGAIPFGYGLIKSRMASGLDVTPAEAALAEKPLSDLAQNPGQHMPVVDEAIQNYTNNSQLTRDPVDQGNVNLKLFDTADVENMQAGMADMLSNKGELDPETLQNIANTSSAFREVLGDPDVMDALGSATEHFENLHNQVNDEISKIAGKNQKNWISTLTDGLSLPEKTISSLKKASPEDFLKNVVDSQRFKGKSLLQTLEEKRPSLDSRAQGHLNQIQELQVYKKQLTHYQRTVSLIKNLSTLKNRIPDTEAPIAQKMQDYMNGRSAEAGPLPQAETEKLGQKSVSQRSIGDESTLPMDSADPILEQPKAELKGGKKFLTKEIEATKKAAESLTKNSKVLNTLMKCISDNRGS